MGPTHTAYTMPADERSVAQSRRHVVELLRAQGWAEARIHDVALMTSELVTNAVKHARTAYTLVVDVSDAALRVDVVDTSAGLGRPTAEVVASPTATSGRGLTLVAALADRWGCDRLADGNDVWFEARPAR